MVVAFIFLQPCTQALGAGAALVNPIAIGVQTVLHVIVAKRDTVDASEAFGLFPGVYFFL